MISDPSRRFVNIISEDKRPVASGYGHFRLNEKRLVRCELISAFIIKLPNQPRHVRQVEHPKFVDEDIAPKSLYMVDEEAGHIGKPVRQFGQKRTHFSGGKRWFDGWGVGPFDGQRWTNLFATRNSIRCGKADTG